MSLRDEFTSELRMISSRRNMGVKEHAYLCELADESEET